MPPPTFDRHPAPSIIQPSRPHTLPSHSPGLDSVVSCAHRCFATLSAMDMYDLDGAAPNREGRGVGMLTPTRNHGPYPLPVPTPRPRMPRLYSCRVHAPRPWQADSQEYVPQRHHDLHLVRWQPVVERRDRPIQVGPAPARSFTAIVKSPPVPSLRVLSPISPAVLSTLH